MIWSLSDSTRVHLGGNVEGASPLAEKLRADSKNARAGAPRAVMSLPPPGTERLRLDDPWHIDCWVRDEAQRFNVYVTDAPDVKAPDEWSEPEDESLGADPVH